MPGRDDAGTISARWRNAVQGRWGAEARSRSWHTAIMRQKRRQKQRRDQSKTAALKPSPRYNL